MCTCVHAGVVLSVACILAVFVHLQVILGMPYDEKVDVWASGCIFAELIKGEVSICHVYKLVQLNFLLSYCLVKL